MPDPPRDAKSIFLAALDVADAAERGAFVERSCGGDAGLKRRVDDLLRAYGQPDGPLDKLAAAMASTEIAEPIREQVGATIGPYKLMEQIGEGGFGLVFVAEQLEPIRRKVALKIIKPGMDTRDVIARFEAERQALALMDHPNIARVLDAGTTQSGRPYFVMELVRGIPITDYCDQSQLTPRERLTLFVDVCNAVQHAHQKGIIHRDIKPSNVLVTLHDDRPVVKVIDFGVAKALHQHLTEKTIYTRYAQMIGTPLYMSPEQAQMSGLDIDTRSDIYSLGVLLYELLTGSTPLDKRRIAQAAYDEMLKIIREEEAPKPSVRLSQSTDTLPSIAALRKTEPARLKKMFDGDVDWIAMKALEKDRTRRYETANAFAADVMRYLNDEPVEASPPSTVYRLRKFARKHRTPVLVVSSIAALLVIGITGTTRSMVLARRAEQAALKAEQEAREQRKAAETEGRKARAAEVEERKQRDQAERQLATGILRPIGFSEKVTDPAELRSFIDWSAIKDPRMKLRVLESIFDDPDTALRVARRSECVIQSCVGLSPTRRDQAIKLVSAKQRDLAADLRSRVAACWLALELGSADLPAWAESCNYLSDHKNQPTDRFGEFVNLAASRTDPQQVVELKLDPLITILETSTNDKVRLTSSNVVPKVAPRLEPAQVKRVAKALVAILEQSTDNRVLVEASSRLGAVETSLEPAQLTRAWDALIALLEKPIGSDADKVVNDELTALVLRLEPTQVKRAADALMGMVDKSRDSGALYAGTSGLRALAPRLESAQLKRALAALSGMLEKSTDGYVLGAASSGLTALAPRLDPVQVKRARDAVIGFLEKSSDNQVLTGASAALETLAARLEPAQAKRAWDALIAILEKPRDFGKPDAKRGLTALALRLEPAQSKRAADALIAKLEKSRELSVLRAANEGLTVLAPRLEPAQAQRAWDAVIANGTNRFIWDSQPKFVLPDVLEALAPRLEPTQLNHSGDAVFAMLLKPTDSNVLIAAQSGLGVLTHRLEPAQVERAADDVLSMLEQSTDSNVLIAASSLLAVLAPRIDPPQAKRAGDALIAILEKSTNTDLLYEAYRGLEALAPRLQSTQLKHAGDALIGILKKSTDSWVRSRASWGLQTLAPRLEPAQLTRAWNALIEVPASLVHGEVQNDPAWAGLVALAPRLEPALQDKLSTTATTAVLDYCSSIDPGAGVTMRPSEVANSIVLSGSMSSPLSLAKLLSHPACVGEQRDVLLKRFEELIFYDGKPVFLKPDAADGKKAAADHFPPRRFHNLHDAADWIQKNWPNFDLETNCPVTWRGSL